MRSKMSKGEKRRRSPGHGSLPALEAQVHLRRASLCAQGALSRCTPGLVAGSQRPAASLDSVKGKQKCLPAPSLPSSREETSTVISSSNFCSRRPGLSEKGWSAWKEKASATDGRPHKGCCRPQSSRQHDPPSPRPHQP